MIASCDFRHFVSCLSVSEVHREMSAIIDVEGIGEVFADKLKEAGIATTAALLEEGVFAGGPQENRESHRDRSQIHSPLDQSRRPLQDQRGPEAVCRIARSRPGSTPYPN